MRQFDPHGRKQSEPTSPGKMPRPGVSPSSLCSKSICSPTQTAKNGLFRIASRTASSIPVVRRFFMQSGIAPCPGKTTRSAFRTSSGSPGDQHLRADRCNFFNGFADAAQIAGAVVNDGYFHNTPFVDGITLRARGSYSQAMRSARPKDLKTDSH